VLQRDPFIMQMMADVMNMSIRIHKSEQTCAAGAAMFAATAAVFIQKLKTRWLQWELVLMQNISRSRQTTIYFQRYRQYGDLGDFMNNKFLP
jgi:L-ribulokinase